MARPMTKGSIKLRAKILADMTAADSLMPDDEWDLLINDCTSTLYDQLISKYQDDFSQFYTLSISQDSDQEWTALLPGIGDPWEPATQYAVGDVVTNPQYSPSSLPNPLIVNGVNQFPLSNPTQIAEASYVCVSTIGDATSSLGPGPQGSGTNIPDLGNGGEQLNGVYWNYQPSFYKLMLAQYQVTNNYWYNIKRFDNRELDQDKALAGVLLNGQYYMRYQLRGNAKMYFQPSPPPSLIARISYIPTIAPLVYDTDLFDGVNGYEQIVSHDAAIKAKVKEGSDITDLSVERAALLKRIEDTAENRDAYENFAVQDVRGTSGGFDYGFD